jgi:UDP-N-acetylglucosamine--N-acetylmuramyl-(pentapeptide) pyrophosphoryl-undecaprenol N-acetylglucosamine transferase
LKVIIAGGGTGGHLFPGVAVGREILKRYPEAKILFITGGKKIESQILKDAAFTQSSILVEGIKGRGWKRAVKSLLKLPYGLVQCISILKKMSPHLVLGVGGYSAGPVCLASWMMGIPTAIHEQNSFPGLTNRLLCRIADRVFISFDESRSHFPKGSLCLTGNPVRAEFFGKQVQRDGNHGFTVLVTGGSQGAMSINRAFLSALELLKGRGKDFKVIHQTGDRDFDWISGEYGKRELQGDIVPFIEDMAEAYYQADIFVGRSGAGTVFELAALGKPSILIPYPHAANRHQEANARVLVNAGGAEMLLEDNLSGKSLADLLLKYLEDRDALKKMGEMALKVAQPNAAKSIVDHLEEMMGRIV